MLGFICILSGVQIIYLNLFINVVQVFNVLEGQEGDCGVSWFLFFYDMGLIMVLLVLVLGYSFIFMMFVVFVWWFGCWICEFVCKFGEIGGIFFVVLNFVFEYVVVCGVF